MGVIVMPWNDEPYWLRVYDPRAETPGRTLPSAASDPALCCSALALASSTSGLWFSEEATNASTGCSAYDGSETNREISTRSLSDIGGRTFHGPCHGPVRSGFVSQLSGRHTGLTAIATAEALRYG